MILECPKCQTRYGLDDNKVANSDFMARCARCGYVFCAYRPVRVEEIRFCSLVEAKTEELIADVVAISNQKGGVAKTSTCLNLGLSLTMCGKRVLMIDFDVQANLTISMGYTEKKSFYDIANQDGDAFEKLILQTQFPGLWLFPSSKNMVLLNKKYFGALNFEYMLKDRLIGLKDRFDFILIDTPPSIEFFTLNALTAANLVIIPSQCDYLSTHGIDQILRLIDLIQNKTNPSIRSQILITMYDHRDTASAMISQRLLQIYSGRIFETRIDMDRRIREAQILSLPVLKYFPESTAGSQYLELAREIIRMRPQWGGQKDTIARAR